MKSILLISPEAWGKSFVSKHHYATELALQGKKVYFLNPPSDKEKITEIKKNLFILDYKISFRGLARMPKWISSFLIKKDIQKIERLAETTFDTIWNFDTSRFFNLSRLKDKFRICHIVDMAENHQRALLASTSDICFCTSDFIAKELLPHNEKVHKIHHGYQIAKQYEIEESFPTNRIQVGYVGNLTRPCIDWDEIFHTIGHNQDVDFNFIGGYTSSNLSKKSIQQEALSFLKKYDNVRLLGQKESHLIPSYLRKFDVLICAYILGNDEEIKQHSNLHKTMEYIGSGNVTVSTYSDEYKDKRELLEMVNLNDDFVGRFCEVVSNLDYYNSEELRNKRIKFALENTYEKQLKKIERYISNG